MTTSHGPIRIAIVPVEAAGRAERRHAECQAVAACFDELRPADPDIPQYSSLSHDPHGAPVLPGWQLSITHSRAVAAVAICRQGQSPAFGIDAEEWRPTLLKVKQKYLSPTELARTLDDCALLRLWTIKEAVYKAAAIPPLPLTAIETTPNLTRAAFPAGAYALHPIHHPATTLTLAIADSRENLC